MKKLSYILLMFVCFSCVDNRYILNSEHNLRPTADRVFKVDKKNKESGDLSIIDTNAIYICNEIVRVNKDIKAVYYRFFSNGNLQEIILYNEDIEGNINNPNIGNVGRYKVLKDNKISLEVLRGYPGEKGKTLVYDLIEFGKIKDGNLYLQTNPFFSHRKGIYQGSGGSIGILPIALVDLMVPDKKNCFKKTKIAALQPISLNY